jgi:hypothetical protein
MAVMIPMHKTALGWALAKFFIFSRFRLADRRYQFGLSNSFGFLGLRLLGLFGLFASGDEDIFAP